MTPVPPGAPESAAADETLEAPVSDVGGGVKEIVLRSPLDGSPLGSVPLQRFEEVRDAIERSRGAQRGWADLSVRDRARRIARLRTEVGRRADELIDTVCRETGKPETEAVAEVLVVVDLMRFFEKAAPDVLGPRRVGTGWMVWKKAHTIREPFGVVGLITPWNYPFILPMEPLVTALFAGNGVVLKPSEYASHTGLLIETLCRDAGLPGNLVVTVTGDGSTGAALVTGGADKIHFVGGPATGRRVMAAAAERLVPVTLELGGKDAAIVLEDADLERAARGVVFGAFFNAGQTCVSVERAFVVDEIYDRFVRRVVQLTGRLSVGSSGEKDVGPLTTPEQLEVVEQHLKDAVERGARVLIGGERTDPASNVFRPTVLVDVDPASKLMTEETFGPLLPVVRVRDQDEAVRLANASRFGLFASVWTGDERTGLSLSRQLRTGGVSINDVLSHWAVPGLPIGGVGESGFGRSKGAEGLREMSRSKSILTQRFGPRREIWWYPYTRGSRSLVRALIDLRAKGGVEGLVSAGRRLMSWRGR
jgi:succinate-semialdehyde dehydrogenase/glutarate-semialdehyde dehydrogenase